MPESEIIRSLWPECLGLGVEETVLDVGVYFEDVAPFGTSEHDCPGTMAPNNRVGPGNVRPEQDGANGATGTNLGFRPQVNTTVEPPRPEDLQKSYASIVGNDAGPQGWYGSMVYALGIVVGTMGAFPCIIYCPNPYKCVGQGNVGLVTKFDKGYKAVDPGLVRINPKNLSGAFRRISNSKGMDQRETGQDNMRLNHAEGRRFCQSALLKGIARPFPDLQEKRAADTRAQEQTLLSQTESVIGSMWSPRMCPICGETEHNRHSRSDLFKLRDDGSSTTTFPCGHQFQHYELGIRGGIGGGSEDQDPKQQHTYISFWRLPALNTTKLQSTLSQILRALPIRVTQTRTLLPFLLCLITATPVSARDPIPAAITHIAVGTSFATSVTVVALRAINGVSSALQIAMYSTWGVAFLSFLIMGLLGMPDWRQRRLHMAVVLFWGLSLMGTLAGSGSDMLDGVLSWGPLSMTASLWLVSVLVETFGVRIAAIYFMGH